MLYVISYVSLVCCSCSVSRLTVVRSAPAPPGLRTLYGLVGSEFIVEDRSSKVFAVFGHLPVPLILCL